MDSGVLTPSKVGNSSTWHAWSMVAVLATGLLQLLLLIWSFTTDSLGLPEQLMCKPAHLFSPPTYLYANNSAVAMFAGRLR